MNEIDSVINRNTEFTFEEAVAYFKDKLPVTMKQFSEISSEYRSLAFTVSGYTKIQVLKKFHDELLRAIKNGDTLRSFKEKMNSFLENEGYEGLTNFQADNIFRTNIQTAYQVGHYEQMTNPDVMKLRPYWIYDAVNDRRTRPSHQAIDGKVFPADSPVWDTWYPPNGFKCRCTVRSLSRRQVEQRELTVETEAPKIMETKDGQVININPDPMFTSNPAKKRFSPDLNGYPDTLVKAYRRQVKSNK